MSVRVQTPIVDIVHDDVADLYHVRITRYSVDDDPQREGHVRVVESQTNLFGDFHHRNDAVEAQAFVWGAVCDGYHTGVAS